jgi:hypothetical protein
MEFVTLEKFTKNSNWRELSGREEEVAQIWHFVLYY